MIQNFCVAVPHDSHDEHRLRAIYDALEGIQKTAISFQWGTVFIYSANEKFPLSVQSQRAPKLQQEPSLDNDLKSLPLVMVDYTTEDVRLTRDALGVGTVYYAMLGDVIASSTNMKDLIAVFPRLRKLNVSAVSEYLLFNHIAGTRTIFSEIEQLEPGTCVSLKLPDTPKAFWNPIFKYTDVTFDVSLNLTEEKLRTLVEDEILTTNLPLKTGLLLSGGIDSSLLCSYLVGAIPLLATFSVGIPNYERSDDQYFEYISKKFGSQQTTLLLTNEQFAQNISKALWHMEEPLVQTNAVPLMLICEVAKARGYDHLITGEGCDGLFSGGTIAKSSAGNGTSTLKNRQIILSYSVTGLGVIRDVLCDDFGDQYLSERQRILSEEFTRLDQHGIDNVLNSFHIRTYTERLARRMFRMSIASNVNCWSPFLTRSFANFLFTIPFHIRNMDGIPKRLMVELASRVFGKEFASRRKVGFNIPIGKWFRNREGLGQYRALLFEERTLEREFYKSRQLRKELLLRFEDEDAPLDYLLWSVLNLELWLRLFIDNEA